MKLPGSMWCNWCRKTVEITWIKRYDRYLAYCRSCHFAIDLRRDHPLEQYLAVQASSSLESNRNQ